MKLVKLYSILRQVLVTSRDFIFLKTPVPELGVATADRVVTFRREITSPADFQVQQEKYCIGLVAKRFEDCRVAKQTNKM